MGMIE